MKITDLTRDRLRLWRWRAEVARRGYEQVGEGGGKLWELYRGHRYGRRIVACVIDPDGKSIWVKIE